MPHATLARGDLYYEVHGDGPPVVFLHGAGGNHLSWWQQVPAFRDRHRCITIDHRGYGQSPDAQDLGMSAFVDDLEVLLRELGVERTALVAQSMGGVTALGFALRHPRRVAALAMCDTWGFFDWPEARARYQALRPSLVEEPPAPGGMGRRFRAEHPAGVFLYQQIGALNPPRGARLAKDLAELLAVGVPSRAGAPARRDVEALRVPALFLVGTEDPLAPPEIMRMTAQLVAGAEYVEIEGCGHSVYFEHPEALNAPVLDFLARHP